MANVVGKATTYDLTEGLYLDFESMIQVLSPFDVPLQGQYGADGRSVLSTGTAFAKKVEWHDESLLTPRSTQAASATTTQNYITVAAGDQIKFSTGDLLMLGNEYALVTGYGTTADTLLVTRGVSGVTNAVSTGDEVIGVGTMLPEGSDPENARATDRNNQYNLTQIFGPYAVQVSGTENVVRKYGIEGTTEFDHQVANRLKEITVALEQTLLEGVRYDDASGKRRAMGGFDYYIQTVKDTTTTALTESALLDLAQTCFDNGGNPTTIVVGSKQKRIISGFTSAGVVQVQRADDEAGRSIDYYDCDFGRYSIVLDRWMRRSRLFGFNRDQAELLTLRPLGMEMLAKTGDSQKAQVLQEKSLRFYRERHAFKFTALT